MGHCDSSGAGNHPDYFTRLGPHSGATLTADAMFALPACATMPEAPVNPASARVQLLFGHRTRRGAGPTSRDRPFPGDPGLSRDDLATRRQPLIASVLSMNHSHFKPVRPNCPRNLVHRIIHQSRLAPSHSCPSNLLILNGCTLFRPGCSPTRSAPIPQGE